MSFFFHKLKKLFVTIEGINSLYFFFFLIFQHFSSWLEFWSYIENKKTSTFYYIRFSSYSWYINLDSHIYIYKHAYKWLFSTLKLRSPSVPSNMFWYWILFKKILFFLSFSLFYLYHWFSICISLNWQTENQKDINFRNKMECKIRCLALPFLPPGRERERERINRNPHRQKQDS